MLIRGALWALFNPFSTRQLLLHSRLRQDSPLLKSAGPLGLCSDRQAAQKGRGFRHNKPRIIVPLYVVGHDFASTGLGSKTGPHATGCRGSHMAPH